MALLSSRQSDTDLAEWVEFLWMSCRIVLHSHAQHEMRRDTTATLSTTKTTTSNNKVIQATKGTTEIEFASVLGEKGICVDTVTFFSIKNSTVNLKCYKKHTYMAAQRPVYVRSEKASFPTQSAPILGIRHSVKSQLSTDFVFDLRLKTPQSNLTCCLLSQTEK